MKMIDLPGTYVHQLNKPANRLVLEGYAKDKDKDVHKFARLFLWLVETLRVTPAWNKPKTNIKINEIKDKLEATIAGAKKGKSTGYAVAGSLLNSIENCRNMYVSEGAGRKVNPGVPADLERFEAQLKELLAVA